MLNQDENFQLAIRKKRARIELINRILAQPRPKGGSVGCMQNFIEERLHLEEALAELEAERHRLELQKADQLFRWEDLDQRLLSPKTNDLAQEMHQRAAEAQRRIAYEIAQSGNSVGYLPRWIDFHEQLADEWAQKLYAAHRQAWTEQNRTISPAFIRAVRDQAIATLMAARRSSVEAEIELRAIRIGETGNPQNAAVIGEWTRRMDRLAARWNRKLEAEAVAAGYRAAKPPHASPHDFGRRSPAIPDESTSVLQSVRPVVVSPVGTGSSKIGRTPIRSADFVNFSGKLWIGSKQENANAPATVEQLMQIASSLDEQEYIPPAKYLEGRCAREVKAFNSKNSNSKLGTIQTWSQLVTVGDKDHLRGMRRLLSRCAEKLSL